MLKTVIIIAIKLMIYKILWNEIGSGQSKNIGKLSLNRAQPFVRNTYMYTCTAFTMDGTVAFPVSIPTFYHRRATDPQLAPPHSNMSSEWLIWHKNSKNLEKKNKLQTPQKVQNKIKTNIQIKIYIKLTRTLNAIIYFTVYQLINAWCRR